MSLQFVLGNSGSGKSTWLYEQVLEEAAAAPQKDFLFLVPEQFTMETQKEFVNRHPRHSILNIDVLSFQRLAYRVFDDLGITDFAVLEETGKNLVIRKLAGRLEGQLKFFQGNLRRPGYISQIKSLLSELKQYHVDPDRLTQVQKDLPEQNALWYKLGDISLVYQAFEDYLEGKYITADQVLDRLTQVAGQSDMLKGSVVVLDGYTGFTPAQQAFLRELLPLAESVRVALSLDDREPVWNAAGPLEDLFYLSRKTIQSLLALARESRTEVLGPVWLHDGAAKRYAQAPAIFHLEQNLFRLHKKAFSGRQDQIRVGEFFQPRDELEYVAGEIRRLVAEEGYRYVDLAVVTGDVAGYADYAEPLFDRYQIPCFIDRKKNILFHPMIELVRSLLEMETENYSYETVMRFFRCGLSGFDRDLIDRMENYLLAFRIRGWSGWTKKWERPVDWLEGAELEELDQKRQEFTELFADWHKAFRTKGKKGTIRLRLTALYELLMLLKVPDQLEEQKKEFESQGMLANAREQEQIFGIVMDLFDKLAELLGDEPVAGREFQELLDAALEASQVGIIPPGYDRVLFGDIERTRLEHIKVLFFVGVNDGIIPKSEASKGILSEMEREKLAALKLELSPTERERSFIQKFYLYLNMTKPSGKLYLTYSNAGADGSPRRPSYLIHTLKGLFPGLEPEQAENREARLATAQSSLPYFLEGLEEAVAGREPEAWKELYAWYKKQPEWETLVDTYIQAAFYRHQDSKLDKDLCRALYGSLLENSVTRLELFASCAFAHFLKYGLRLSQRQISSFEAVDFGNILHEALEVFGRYMESGREDWFTIQPEKQEEYARRALDQAIADCGNTALADGERNQYLVHRMERVMERTVEVLVRQLRQGNFKPENYELAFQRVNSLDSVNFSLSREERMRLQGRIDRMDTLEKDQEIYVKVLDYKSGNTKFQLLSVYHGLQLQLVVYLNAASELLKRKYKGKEVDPGGILYFHIDDPLLETDQELSDAQIKDQIFSRFKLDGYVNADPKVYQEMDTQLSGSSDILPVRENKDGSLSKTSHAASREEFASLSIYVDHKIKELGREMLDGDIAVNPFELDGRTACDYCRFRGICGFDERILGYQYRKLEDGFSNKEILKKMGEDNERSVDKGPEEGH